MFGSLLLSSTGVFPSSCYSIPPFSHLLTHLQLSSSSPYFPGGKVYALSSREFSFGSSHSIRILENLVGSNSITIHGVSSSEELGLLRNRSSRGGLRAFSSSSPSPRQSISIFGDSFLGSDDEDDGKNRSTKGRGRNINKRGAQHCRNLAMALLKISSHELSLVAMRMEFSKDFLDAIALAKSLTPKAKNGWRRQILYIAGVLRCCDVGMLENALLDARDGKIERFSKSIPQDDQKIIITDVDKNSPQQNNYIHAVNLISKEQTIFFELPKSYSESHLSKADAWFESLITKDHIKSKEIFSLNFEEGFDRQELTKVVKVAIKEYEASGYPSNDSSTASDSTIEITNDVGHNDSIVEEDSPIIHSSSQSSLPISSLSSFTDVVESNGIDSGKISKLASIRAQESLYKFLLDLAIHYDTHP